MPIQDTKITQKITTFEYFQNWQEHKEYPFKLTENKPEKIKDTRESSKDASSVSSDSSDSASDVDCFNLHREDNKWKLYYINGDEVEIPIIPGIMPGLEEAIQELPTETPVEAIADDQLNKIKNVIKTFQNGPEFLAFKNFSNFLYTKDKNPVARYTVFWECYKKGILDAKTVANILKFVPKYNQLAPVNSSYLAEAWGNLLLSREVEPESMNVVLDLLNPGVNYSNMKMEDLIRKKADPVFEMVYNLKTCEFLARSLWRRIEKEIEKVFDPTKAAIKTVLTAHKLYPEGKTLGINTIDPSKISEVLEKMSQVYCQADSRIGTFMDELLKIFLKYLSDSIETAANHPWITFPLLSVTHKNFNTFLYAFFGNQQLPQVVYGNNSSYFITQFEEDGQTKRAISRITKNGQEMGLRDATSKLIKDFTDSKDLLVKHIIEHNNEHYFVFENKLFRKLVFAQLDQKDNKDILKKIPDNNNELIAELSKIVEKSAPHEKDKYVYLAQRREYTDFSKFIPQKRIDIIPNIFIKQMNTVVTWTILASKVLPRFRDEFYADLISQFEALRPPRMGKKNTRAYNAYIRELASEIAAFFVSVATSSLPSPLMGINDYLLESPHSKEQDREFYRDVAAGVKYIEGICKSEIMGDKNKKRRESIIKATVAFCPHNSKKNPSNLLAGELQMMYLTTQEEYEQKFNSWAMVHKAGDVLLKFFKDKWTAILVAPNPESQSQTSETKQEHIEIEIDPKSDLGQKLQEINPSNIDSFDHKNKIIKLLNENTLFEGYDLVIAPVEPPTKEKTSVVISPQEKAEFYYKFLLSAKPPKLPWNLFFPQAICDMLSHGFSVVPVFEHMKNHIKEYTKQTAELEKKTKQMEKERKKIEKKKKTEKKDKKDKKGKMEEDKLEPESLKLEIEEKQGLLEKLDVTAIFTSSIPNETKYSPRDMQLNLIQFALLLKSDFFKDLRSLDLEKTPSKLDGSIFEGTFIHPTEDSKVKITTETIRVYASRVITPAKLKDKFFKDFCDKYEINSDQLAGPSPYHSAKTSPQIGRVTSQTNLNSEKGGVVVESSTSKGFG